VKLAPEAGFEPATSRLTAGCSTVELLWNQTDIKFTNLIPLRQFVLAWVLKATKDLSNIAASRMTVQKGGISQLVTMTA
jgi:hypothetical protein